ncbi:MAG: hypothetical protein ACFFF9_12830 [Candidatus Thorarchaeota archaeon]
MGLKAEGAAQGFTVLGGLVLLIYSIFRIYSAAIGPGPGTPQGLMEILLGIVLILIVALAFDACGFIYWKIKRSGVLLALFGLIAIVIVSYPGFSFDIIAWMMRNETLAGFMILLGGLLLVVRK